MSQTYDGNVIITVINLLAESENIH